MDELAIDLAMLPKLFDELIPFNRVLGIQTQSVERGRVLLKIPFRDELIGDPMRYALHGGVLSAMIDTAGGGAVWTKIEPHDRVSTIDLRVDYLRKGLAEAIFCEAKVVRIGNRVGVATATCWHESAPSDPIATGTGVYSIKRG